MPRPLREIEPGVCYHILNRGNNRQTIFHKAGDYEAFLSLLTAALKLYDVDLLCWCLMPNHWHLVLRPRRKGIFPAFMRWLTHTHVLRHHGHFKGQSGHLYQGRYRSFPVQDDGHFLFLCRYIEMNALRAKLVSRAEDWRWSSLWQRAGKQRTPPLSKWPVERPPHWIEIVNEPIAEKELEALNASFSRQRPFGDLEWVLQVVKRLSLTQTTRSPGRPAKPNSEIAERQKRRRNAADRKRP